MRNYIVSTCGTSLLTNSVPEQVGQLNRLTNKKENELQPEEREIIDNSVENVRKQLEQINDIQQLREKSAELNTILGLYHNQIDKGKNDYHLLLHTDTYEGKQAAQLLEQWLKSHKIVNVQCYQCEDLTTVDTKSFQHGLTKLAKYLTETLQELRKQYHIIFQLSAGFKALHGFMQTVGMFFADEIVYIFEKSDELIRIPRIPVKLDDVVTKIVTENLNIFRLLACQGISQEKIPDTLKTDLGLFIEQVDNMVSLTAWGALCWNLVKKAIYEQKLWDTPYKHINYGAKFADAACRECTSPLRWRTLNERIDDLAQFLETNQKINRLDFKQIKGQQANSLFTHECDAWSESPGHRIFMHKDKDRNVWILDDLAPGIGH